MDEDQGVFRIDLVARKRIPFRTNSQRPSVSPSDWHAFSPGGQSSAWIANKLNSIIVIDSASGAGREVYRTPVGSIVTTIAWSGDGSALVATIGAMRAGETQFDVAPTSIVRIDAANGTAVTVVQVGRSSNIGSLAADSIRVSADGKTVLFAGSKLEPIESGTWMWKFGAARPVSLPAAIDLGITFGDDRSPLTSFFLGNDHFVIGYRIKINVISLSDFSTRTIPITSDSPMPFSPIIPDGHSILLIERQSSDGAALEALNLLTGEKSTVATSPSAQNDLHGLVWAPDARTFLLPVDAQVSEYLIGQLGSKNLKLRVVRDSLLPISMPIRAILPEG